MKEDKIIRKEIKIPEYVKNRIDLCYKKVAGTQQDFILQAIIRYVEYVEEKSKRR